MSSAVGEIVETLREAYRRGTPLRLLFDYDGTLAPLVAHPAVAVLTAETRGHLDGLSRQPRVRVGIVSGRTLVDLKSRIALPQADYGGTGGLEWEIEGRPGVHDGALAAAPQVRESADRLRPVVDSFPGTWIEPKPLAFTVHYRSLPESGAPAFEREIRRVLGSLGTRLRIVRATASLEVSPQVAWDKGSWIRLLQGASPARGGLLYAGDSEGDAEAVEAVAALGGLTVGVGPEAPSSCSLFLPDPAGVSALLGALLEELRGEAGPS